MMWSLVNGMALQPYCCAACGNTPQDEDGPAPAAFAEGVDINWGDSLYLCRTCVRIVGQLIGMDTEENVAKVRKELKELQEDYNEATMELKKVKGLINRMKDGAQARKEARAVR